MSQTTSNPQNASLLQRFTTSAFALRCALLFGLLVPARLGYAIARDLARRVAKHRESSLARAIRLNQSVVRGITDPAELDRCVEQVLQSQGHFLFDFFHNLRRPQRVLNLVHLSPEFSALLERIKTSSQPAVFVAPHVGPIDLAGFALALHGMPVQVLSYPQLNSGYSWQNYLRRKQGIHITPISQTSLIQARALLQKGGSVLTGLDRPNPGSGYAPRFFGHPAEVPVFYVRLALKAGAPVYVITVHTDPAGGYILETSEPVIMKPSADPHEEYVSNAERVLAEGEKLIARYPEQWSMFYPVWPELTEKVK